MATILDIVRACQSATVLHVYLRYVEELVRTVRPSLYLFVRCRCPKEFVEDVLEETLIAITQSVRKFHGGADGSVWEWCYGIARHKIADNFRTESRAARLSMNAEEIARTLEAAAVSHTKSPREMLELKETAAMLNALGAQCQELLWKRCVDGWSFVELAQVMEKSPDAVRMAVNRCKEQAEKILQSLER